MAKKNPKTVAIADMPNTHEKRDPQKLKNHLVNQKIYGDTVSVEFVEDVRNRGIQDEIHVTENDVVIAGHKRRQAALTIGIEEVNVWVRRDLKTPEDIIEALICSNQHQRERTTEQKAREFQHLKEIEEKRAKDRMVAGVKDPSPCEGLGSGKSTDIAAKQSGLGKNTAPKAAAVVEEIDKLDKTGETEKADDLRDTLNKSVAEADRKIQEPNKKKAKSKTKPKRFDFKETRTLTGKITRSIDKCAKHHGLDLNDGRPVVLRELLSSFLAEYLEWEKELK